MDPSVAVVTAVAAETGEAPTVLEPPLGEIIDLEAFVALFPGFDEPERSGTHVRFEHAGYTVSVGPNGQVDGQ